MRTVATLNLTDVNRIATAAAHHASPDLRVVGVTFNSGGTDYVEILLDMRGSGQTEPSQLVVGAFRNVAEATLQLEIIGQLRRHLAHRT